MERYLVIVEHTKTGFSAYVPDLPGCVSTGRTREEVEKNIREAIQFHIEGLRLEGYPVPKPSSESFAVAIAFTHGDQVVRKGKLENALREVREFLDSLQDSGDPTHEHRRAMLFSDVNEGTLSLEPGEARKYRECIDVLHDAVSGTVEISRRGVEKLLQRAIWQVVDIRKQRAGTPATRQDQAISDLQNSLSSPPVRYRVYYPVNGLDLVGLPFKVGNVTFAEFDAMQVQEFRDAVTAHPVGEEQKRKRIQVIEEMAASDELSGQAVGITEVLALDASAAESAAFRELRLATDVVNFYSDMLPYNSAYIALPGDADEGKIAVPKLVLHSEGPPSFSINYRNIGRTGKLSLRRLEEADIDGKLGFARVCQLLVGRRSTLEDQIIASLQWAGRATVDRRKEEAFLLYAIALESLVMGDLQPGELSYRLKLRIAHLLGGTAEERAGIFKEVGDLYQIRSKIVHSGRYQVADADFGLMRMYAKASIIRLCTSEDLTSMSTPSKLADWFHDRLLE